MLSVGRNGALPALPRRSWRLFDPKRRPRATRAGILLCAIGLGLIPRAAAAGLSWQWASIFPAGGNHYAWGYEDSNYNSNWVNPQYHGLQINFPYAGDLALITQPLTADEFIDLYTVLPPISGGDGFPIVEPGDYTLDLLSLDAGPAGNSYTIEQYAGQGSLLFEAASQIIVGNDAGRDVIACPVEVLGALRVSGNALLMSGPIIGGNPGTQLSISNCRLTLAGNNSYHEAILQGGAFLSVSSASNLGEPTGLVHFQGGTLHVTQNLTASQSIQIDAAGANVVVDPAATLTLTGPLTAGGNLDLSGGGALALALASPFPGALVVHDSSTLVIGSTAALGDPAAAVVLDVATLRSAGSASIQAHLFLTSSSPGQLFGGGAWFDVPANSTLTLAGPIDGDGPLTKTGPGVLALGVNNHLTGGVTANAGTVRVATLRTGGMYVANGATVPLGDAGTIEFLGNVRLGDASYAANGAQVFAAANGGRLIFSNSSSADLATITSNGGSVFGAGGALTLFQDVSTAGSATLVTNGGAGQGATTQFILLASGGNARVITNAGGTFDISGSILAGFAVGSIQGAGAYRLGGRSLSFGSLGTNTEVSGAISDGGLLGGSGGSIVKEGPGTTTLSGINSYTGPTVINSGTLRVSGSIAASSAITINPGAALNFTLSSSAGGTPITVMGASQAPTLGGSLQFTQSADAGTATIVTQGANAFNAAWGQTAFLDHSRAANATLITQGSSNGGFGGLTLFAGSAADNNARVITDAGGIFDISGLDTPGITVGSIDGAGFYQLGGKTLTFGARGTNSEVAGSIVDGGIAGGAGGSIVKAGQGVTVLSGVNSYTGTTTVNGGVLELTGSIPSSGAVTANLGGAFDISGLVAPVVTVGSIQGTGAFRLGSKTLIFGALGDNTQVMGVISDPGIAPGSGGSIVKEGSGLTLLGGMNSYTGTTTVNAGTLTVSGSIAASSAVTIRPTAQLNFISLAKAGPMPIFINGTSAVSQPDGAILEFYENASADHATITTAGSNVPGGLGGETAFLANSTAGSATLITQGGVNGGGGGITWMTGQSSGGDARVITGAGGAFDISGVAGNGVSVGSIEGSGTYQLGGKSLTFGGLGSDTEVSGIIRNAGISGGTGASIVKEGAGTTLLSGSNAYTGETIVNGGTLAVSGSIVPSSIARANPGGTLRFLAQASPSAMPINVYGAVATAGPAGALEFLDFSSAGSSAIAVNGGNAGSGGPAPGATVRFEDHSSAGSASIEARGGNLGGLGGTVQFADQSSGGQASLSAVNGAVLRFTGFATADGARLTVSDGGAAEFHDAASAGLTSQLSINPNGQVTFEGGAIADDATAGSASILNNAGGQIDFRDHSRAGNAQVVNEDQLGRNVARIRFFISASAAAATFTNQGGRQADSVHGGIIEFHDTTTAASAQFTNYGASGSSFAFGGEIDFYDASNAGTDPAHPAQVTNGGGTGGFGAQGGTTQFFNTARGGVARFINNGADDGGNNAQGGYTIFNDSASADHANFVNLGSAYDSSTGFTAGHTVINSGATADHGVFLNMPAPLSGGHGGETDINAGATADHAIIVSFGANVSGAAGGRVVISGPSFNPATAAFANITAKGGTASGAPGGLSYFTFHSNAGHAIVTANGGTAPGALGGLTYFDSTSSAGSATLIANGGSNGGAGGIIQFAGGSGFSPDGGSARVIVNAGGIFDKSDVGALTVGSIEGAGQFNLGTGSLTCGSLGTDTTVSGVLADGGIVPGGVGALIKEGTGKLTLSGANTYTGGTAVNGGTLVFASPAAMPPNSPIAIAPGAVLRFAPATFPVISASKLTLASGGMLDLTSNDLLMPYTGASPLPQFQMYVRNWVDGLTSQPMLGSSVADDPDVSQFARTLAVFDNHNYHATIWNNVPLTNYNQVLVKYTYLGDANLDGQVTPTDYAIVDGNIGRGSDWATGDLNGDGKVSPQDYAQIDGNIGAGRAGVGGPQLAGLPIPEPLGLLPAALGVLLCLRTRRRSTTLLRRLATRSGRPQSVAYLL